MQSTPNEYDSVLINGRRFPATIQKLSPAQSEALEEWKRRMPGVEVLEAHVASDNEIELTVAYIPAHAVGRIESTLVFRQDEPGDVHSDIASG
jgi:hypothetical protein